MPEIVRNEQQSTVESQKKPWLRQDGESALWFNRFRRYMDIGPKRSLQAAVEQERSQITALKSTKEAQKKEGGSRKKLGVTQKIAALPPAKPQVPGSWKAASKQWRWVERAKAWDAHVIDYSVEQNLQEFLSNHHTTPMARIKTLEHLLKKIEANYNAGNQHMTYDQDIKYFTAMQSILRDIRTEMSLYDEAVARAALRMETTKLYNELTPEEIRNAPRTPSAAKKK